MKIGPLGTTYSGKMCAYPRRPKLFAEVVPTVIVPLGVSETDGHLKMFTIVHIELVG